MTELHQRPRRYAWPYDPARHAELCREDDLRRACMRLLDHGPTRDASVPVRELAAKLVVLLLNNGEEPT